MTVKLIPGLFEQTLAAYPQNTAIQVYDSGKWRRLSYSGLKREYTNVSIFLRSRGLKKGDRVAVILESRPEWPILYLGIVSCGCVCVPLDCQLHTEELLHFLHDSCARIVFYSNSTKQKLPAGQLSAECVLLDDFKADEQKWLSLPGGQDDCRQQHEELVPDDLASLLYTSGTTGAAKGVMLTHFNLCSNFLSIKKLDIIKPSDNFLSMLPLHHSYPFMVTVLVPLFYGAKISFCPPNFRPDELADYVRTCEATILTGVPQLFSLLYTSILKNKNRMPLFLRFLFPLLSRPALRRKFGKQLRLMVSGGAKLNPEVFRGLTQAGLRIIEGYGLSETSPVVTINPPGKQKCGSAGKPLPDVEVRIHVPAADQPPNGNATSGVKESGGEGQVIIRGPNVMKGYYRNPEMTADVIRDGWLYTKDIGCLDKDGYLYLTGREADLIVLSSGKTIYPEELEEIYSKSKYIKEICILGKKELVLGRESEMLFAVIFPDFDYFRSRKESNIRGKIKWELENISQGLPSYKHVMGFTLAKEEFPKTPLRKLKRYLISDMYLKDREEHPDAVQKAGDEHFKDDLERKVAEFLSGQLSKNVLPSHHLELDLGIDSLSKVELAICLERHFSLHLPDSSLQEVATVRDLVDKIRDLRPGQNSTGRSGPAMSKARWDEILKSTPGEEFLSKVRLRPILADYILTAVFKSLFWLIFRIFWCLRFRRAAVLKNNPPLIITPNHVSYLDGILVGCGLPFRMSMNTYFVGYQAILGKPWLAWSLKFARLLPIDPSCELEQAMSCIAFLLSKGKNVCIFPEGERSIDGRVKEFKKGVGILINELNIPVLPVFIDGAYKAWPRTISLPRFCRINVTYGAIVAAEELQSEGQIDKYAYTSGKLMQIVAGLGTGERKPGI